MHGDVSWLVGAGLPRELPGIALGALTNQETSQCIKDMYNAPFFLGLTVAK